MWSEERLTKRQLTSRPDHLWPELWDKMGKNAKLKEKQKWAHEKIHLDNARKFRGIYFIDPEDKEFKETIKSARKKLETPMAPAMPCKIIKSSKNCENGESTWPTPRTPHASYGPGNQELGQNYVSGSTGKLARHRSQNPTTHSQEWQEDDNPFQCTWKRARHLENQLGRTRLDYHSPQVSDSSYIEKVLKTLRQKLNCSENDKMRDMNTNVLIWGLFMSTTKKASVHLGPNYNVNLEVYRNNKLRRAQDFVRYHARSWSWARISRFWMFPRLSGHTLPGWDLHCYDQVIKWARAIGRVYSDSVLCMGKMYEHTEANAEMERSTPRLDQSNACKGYFWIDGELIEFEWNIGPGQRWI